MFEELIGLASALEDVHSYRCQEIQLEPIGCHHDLNPNNILISNVRLKLANFELSRLIPLEQGSKTNFKDCIGDYFSPECMDNNFSRPKIGRPSDIWSLGCLVVELITFYEYGPSGILEFRSARRTGPAPRYITSWFHSGGEMKTEAESWLSKLIRNSQDDNVEALIALT
jgi:serine/threonine protein kinase